MYWFVVAAIGELAGCYAIWLWAREGGSFLLIPLGVVALLGFAWALSRAPAAFAGRAFAAYAGVYLLSALAWIMVIDRQRPDRWDLIGAGLALVGAAVILYGPRTVA